MTVKMTVSMLVDPVNGGRVADSKWPVFATTSSSSRAALLSLSLVSSPQELTQLSLLCMF